MSLSTNPPKKKKPFTPQVVRKKPFIRLSCLYTNNSDPQPMTKFKITNSDFLDTLDGRNTCSSCGKSRRYFCYTCCIPLEIIKSKLPYLKLPVKIDVIKHARETEGKSTAIHAAILAPEDVTVHIYPEVPDYSDMKVLLVFPGKDTKTLKEYTQSWSSDLTDSENLSEAPNIIDRIVFIDSTWRQTKRIYGDEHLNQLPCVLLKDHDSLFWRHQHDKPLNFLSTIEAIYYFLVEYHQATESVPYDSRYDDMLFFFNYMYSKIKKVYDPRVESVLLEKEDT